MIIHNPVVVCPDVLTASNEAEMNALLQEFSIGLIVKYTGSTGLYESGAYYKIVADEVTE